ncbi:uncharacterized protein N7496_011485 [Penicillium cataractarum]|uniref:Uncharacterized protein n=1 Tax=Penicillium cataractarum TaxID=2100454 RepID=A0A9W9RFL2_9EURO|nr:uncharacterized protein N7496_011485 [Penicillium cataractarum]KAJ5359072.1 hypothetical protein N7496_011485 [Penicillium cataractarum]
MAGSRAVIDTKYAEQDEKQWKVPVKYNLNTGKLYEQARWESWAAVIPLPPHIIDSLHSAVYIQDTLDSANQDAKARQAWLI